MNYIEEIALRIRSEVDTSLLPEGDISELFRIYALLALSAGRAVSSANIHDAWAVWMTSIDPRHPSLVPFEELSSTAAADDEPFVEAVRRIAAELERGCNN